VRDLKDQFTEAMFDTYRRAMPEAKYSATMLLRMITDDDGAPTALVPGPRGVGGGDAVSRI
jgi:hypothetical protein